MLAEFRTGSTPPFVLSDAWPGDLLPLPAHISRDTPTKSKSLACVSAPTFESITAGEATTATTVDNAFTASARLQAAMDRDTGSTSAGQLFETHTQQIHASCDSLSVYIRSERYTSEVATCFRAQAMTGFGKKSSAGLGQFEVAGAPESCPWLDGAPGANAWIALNHFVPAPNDPTEGKWRTHVTFPKFHANSASNVFKGSILMLTPGSVFRVGGGTPRLWYDSMIGVPRPEMPGALHYALGFSVPAVWNKEVE